MKSYRPVAIVVSMLLGGLAAVSVATAAFHPSADLATLDTPTGHGAEAERLMLPLPVSSDILFVEQGYGATCLKQDEVVDLLSVELRAVGGQIIEVEKSFYPAFAEKWRHSTFLPPVRISGVIGHLFPIADGWMVDLVEFDLKGCAVTRTLIGDEALEFLLS